MAIVEAGMKKVKESEREEADEANSGSDSDDEDDEDEQKLEREVSSKKLICSGSSDWRHVDPVTK
jgi:hypothetical protein